MAKNLQKGKRQTIVIIGAALAGPTAAARAREIDEHAEIILLERNTRVSYAMTGLSLHLAGDVLSLDELNRERADFFRNVYNIDVRTETEVLEIRAKKKTLVIAQGIDQSELRYDKLIFAAGAASIKPIGMPLAVSNFAYFRTLDDLAQIKASLASGRKRFVVLGGGSMGAEALDGLVRGGGNVTVIEKKSQFLPDYSPEIAGIAVAAESPKVKFITGFRQMDFISNGQAISAVQVDGNRIETDFVISAIGVTPRTELLKKAGVKLAFDGSILIDAQCRTSAKDIFACSICVSVPEGKGYRFIPQAAVSDKTAQVAGENAAGGHAKLGSFTGAQIIRLPSLEIGRVGLTFGDAKTRYGKKNIASVFIHARDKEPYMPKSAPIALKLFYDKKTEKVIALEAVGQNIKSRLDTFAAALIGGLTLSDLAMLDFAYTPAFGTTRDALNAAATVAAQVNSGLTSLVTQAEIRADRKKYFVLDVSAKASHIGYADARIPLEELRVEIETIRQKLKAAKAKRIATLSETGRRGHLALRILASHGFSVANIVGGKT